MKKPYLVVDTNILLIDAENIRTLGQNYTLVLPETVLDEVDGKKTSTNPEIKFQVRELGRILTRATNLPIERTAKLTVIPSDLDGIRIETVSRSDYPDYGNVDASIVNDRRIIQIAQDYANLGHDVTFMTNDVMCNKRALAFGLKVTDLKIVEDRPIEFVREVSVPSDVFATLHNSVISHIVPDHRPENYNYKFIDSTTGQVKLANLRSNCIDILGKETEAELRRQDAAPRNAEQLFLSRAIQNSNVDIVVCDAAAGTGKTLTAFSNAIQLVKRKEYGGILYIRTSVDDAERAEENGFRSGNEEKTAPFFTPVYDVLNHIARSRFKDSKLKGREYEDFIQSQIEELTDKYNIQTTTTLGMRGRTLDNMVAIIDECQNMSKSSMQKVLTRFGKDSKIILIGSNRQIDNPYISKYNNGLAILLDACTKAYNDVSLHVTPLTRILRSNIAEFAERVFSNDKV